VLSVWINSNDRPIKPAFAPPNLGIQEDLNPVADLDFVCHTTLCAAIYPKHETNPDHDHHPAVDRPLRIACHIAAGQNVNSLQEEGSSGQDKQNTNDIQN